MDNGKDPQPAVWYLAATPVAVSRWVAGVVLVVSVLMASVSAHDVVVDQVVQMVVEPHGDQLLVRLHVPASVAVDERLARVSNPILDVTATDESLRIVAADIVRNLDMQQANVALPEPIATARAGADRGSVDVELRYAAREDTAGFSARLNAFRAGEKPVRTIVRYQPPTGDNQTISVTGPPARVFFDPATIDVLQQFATRGLRALLDGGDHLLFLVCVLLPVRRGRTAASLFAAGALGQTIAIAVSVLQPSISADSFTALAMIAASAVVIAALQTVVQAHLRWVVLLALVFGALNGFAFGSALVPSEQFAGSHRSMAVATFAAVALVGELWLGALAWTTRAWLDERGVPERFASVLASAIIAHSAMHRVVDRGHILAQTGSFGAERALVWLALGWAGVVMIVALAAAVSGRTRDSHDSVPRAKAAVPS